MGTFAFKMPDIGEGVVEGEVVEWMVAVGDTVTEDQPILSVMTDKATVEIPSPFNGVVVKREGDVGDILPVGVVCIEFEVEGEGNASAGEAPAPAAEAAPAPAATPAPAPTPAPVAAAPAPVTPRVPGLRPLASPAVRMSAREAGVGQNFLPQNPIKAAPKETLQTRIAPKPLHFLGMSDRLFAPPPRSPKGK